MLRNIDTVKTALFNHGFGRVYDKAIEDGIMKGLKEIPLEPITKKYGDNEWLQFEPRVSEGSRGRSYFNGFQASLIIGDELIATNLYGNYRMAGMTTEQARMHLHGATVLHKEYLDSREAITPVYSKIQYPAKEEAEGNSQEQPSQMRKGEKLPNIMVPADGVDIARLVSMEEIYANAGRKERVMQDLQEGKVVDVMIQHREVGKDPVLRRVFMELSLDSRESMSLILSTPEGQFLRKNEMPILSNANAISQGQVIGTGEEMPDKVKNLFNNIAKGLSPEETQTQRQNPVRFRLGSAGDGAATTATESKGDMQQPGAGSEKTQGEGMGKEKSTEKATQVLTGAKNRQNPRLSNGIK